MVFLCGFLPAVLIGYAICPANSFCLSQVCFFMPGGNRGILLLCCFPQYLIFATVC